MLKIAMAAEEKFGGELMQWWNVNGAARVEALAGQTDIQADTSTQAPPKDGIQGLHGTERAIWEQQWFGMC